MICTDCLTQLNGTSFSHASHALRVPGALPGKHIFPGAGPGPLMLSWACPHPLACLGIVSISICTSLLLRHGCSACPLLPSTGQRQPQKGGTAVGARGLCMCVGLLPSDSHSGGEAASIWKCRPPWSLTSVPLESSEVVLSLRQLKTIENKARLCRKY